MTATKSKAQLAREAGAEAGVTWPLRRHDREANYARQNALIGRTKLTARQERQVNFMYNRALVLGYPA